ncbi:MAG: hypothetical protein WC729_14410 [Sphingomonas sp.]|jgi:hypothetical protein|uniref:hypothetical protein n=1 Tax=Sphingomonas sp. TaxID=28214 RepID=UPI00356603EA
MTIRVLLGATTAMVRSALHGALAGCEDIELIQPASPDTVIEDVDVVVLHQAAMRDFPVALRAIVEAPHIGVVAIGEDGQAGSLYRVDRQGWRFAAGGEHGLADAIRAVARAG